MKKLLLPVLFLLSFIAQAQFTTNVNSNTTVSDDPTAEEAVPIAVQGNAGKTIVTYFNTNSGGTYNLSMQTLDQNGYALLGTTGSTISAYPQNTFVTTYDTKVDGEGSIITAFTDIRTGNGDVTGYRMTDAGAFSWGPAGVALNDPLAAGGIAPNVGILTNGDAVISWTADGTPKDWVCFQRISQLGVTAYASPMRIIDSTFTATYTQSQVVPMQNGDFMIFYTKQTGFFPPICNMYMQRFDLSGQPVWAQAVHISTKTISAFAAPSIIADGNNGAYIAFSSSSPSGTIQNDVYLQHIDENGVLWSAMGTEACTGVNSQRLSPTVCFENGMPYPVVLMKETDLGQSSAGVTIQAFDPASGNALWAPNGIAVTPITASYDEPYDIRSLCGGLVILYAEGLTGNNTMYATKVDYNGAPLWTPATVMLSSIASNKLRGQLTPEYTDVNGQPQVVAVWEDERNGRGIYAQNIACDGTIGPQFLAGINSFNSKNNSVDVYPNPGSHQTLRVFSKENGSASIILKDMAGRNVGTIEKIALSSGWNTFELDAIVGKDVISQGVYMLQLNGPFISSQTKLIVK